MIAHTHTHTHTQTQTHTHTHTHRPTKTHTLGVSVICASLSHCEAVKSSLSVSLNNADAKFA